MALDLFAGIPVDDYAGALAWYERLFGAPPTYVASDTEAVWELAEHRSVAVERRPEHAGHAIHTIFVDDFDVRLAQIAEQGIEPAKQETYGNGVRHVTYHDPEGNEISFGGAPAATTRLLETPEVDLTYDVHGPLPTADGRPPLVMIGQPMDASGFSSLASHFPDRTVVTYDPRGLGRSTRKDGRVDHEPATQAADVHAVITALDAGPVEMFASSGGAVTALALVATYPDVVSALVAHEPPLIPVLPDAEAAERARAGIRDAYEAKGSGAGMAAFIAMTSWQGELTDDYFNQPAPDPAAFGMSTEDDGSRDDPLLSDRSWAISDYQPDVAAVTAAPTRIVIAVGEESREGFTGRTALATAELLGQQATVFPSHHGGFLGGEFGYAGQPEAFAHKLREVLDDPS